MSHFKYKDLIDSILHVRDYTEMPKDKSIRMVVTSEHLPLVYKELNTLSKLLNTDEILIIPKTKGERTEIVIFVLNAAL